MAAGPPGEPGPSRSVGGDVGRTPPREPARKRLRQGPDVREGSD